MVGSSSRTTTALHATMRLNTRALGLQSCQRRERYRECSATQVLLHPVITVDPSIVNLKFTNRPPDAIKLDVSDRSISAFWHCLSDFRSTTISRQLHRLLALPICARSGQSSNDFTPIVNSSN